MNVFFKKTHILRNVGILEKLIVTIFERIVCFWNDIKLYIHGTVF